MTLTIRPLERQEWPRFLERIVETTWYDLPPVQQATLSREALAPGLRRLVELLMEQGENLFLVADTPQARNVGQIWLGEARDPYSGQRRGYIYDLYVEAAQRGQGVGKALLQAAEAASRQRGDPVLALTVARHNGPARALYAALGFEPERLILTKTLD